MSRSEHEPAVAAAETAAPARGELDELTPHEIVRELDEYIIGQEDAKKAVAIALRNRWRRRHVEVDLRDEILPNNIIMIGPTGVGKTEIARRLARLAGAPFVKVEASKFTEVGYVGRDVESMVRDLVDIGVNLVREEREEAVREQAERRVEEELLDLLLPPVGRERTRDGRRGGRGRSHGGGERETGPGAREPGRAPGRERAGDSGGEGEGGAPRTFVVGAAGQAQEERERSTAEPGDSAADREERRARTREKLRGLLRDGKLEDREVEVEVTESSAPALDFNAPGLEGLDWSVGEMLQQMMPKKTRRRTVTVSEARRILLSEELETMIDQDEVVDEALHRVENMGIVFLDELDKVAGERGSGSADVSREGVQRDLLPIVEGSTVPTKYGMVETDHVLFIAAGAFHVSKPSDLIPELQGRFPIRVELNSLDEDDFVRILQEPRNALLTQYRALVRTEGAELEYTDEAIAEMARIAAEVNAGTENIGARRLHTILTTLLEKLMFDLPDEGVGERLVVDGEYVRERLAGIASDEDLRRYIL